MEETGIALILKSLCAQRGGCGPSCRGARARGEETRREGESDRAYEERITAPWFYVVIRRDLPAELLVCMASHASGEAASNKPVPKTARLCLLGVANEAELKAIHETIKHLGVAAISESEGGFAGQVMALGYFGARADIRPLLAHLKRFTFKA